MEDRLKIVIKPEDTLNIGMQEQEPLQLRLGNAVIPTGTTNYNELGNKPKINGVTLKGNKSASELGLVNKAGDTMTGALSVPTPLSVVGETGAHIQLFNTNTSDTSNPIGDLFINNTNRRITIREKAVDGHSTDYNFPAPDGSSDTSYDVITSKGGTMTGYLQLPRAQFQDGDYPRITFLDSSTSTVVGSIINHNAQRRTLVRQVSNNGSEETFQFPSSSSATSSAYYDVITSKGGVLAGDLTAPNYIVKGSASGVSPAIFGRNSNDSSLGTIDFLTNGQIQFRSYVIGVGSENYKLPAPTSAGTEYGILTSKFTGNEVSTAGTSVTVPNNTVTNIASITLPAGTWIIQFMAIFTSNSTGYRQIGLGANAAESHMTRYCKVIVGAASGNDTQISSTTILAPSAQTTYYLNVVQTSGGNLSVIGGLNARRLL